MYPSYNNSNYPLHYPSLSSLTYTQEDTPPPPPSSSSFYNFTSPAMPYEDDILLRQHLHDLLLQHPPQPAEASSLAELTDSVHNSTESVTQCQSTNEPTVTVPGKKPSKKDRHSKIETAQGPRDRRMRLSLEVAPQFFGLQDMLGFDKASKTVGWLLSNSKNAIRELKKSVHRRMTNRSPCDSEGEDGSGTDESPDRQFMKGIINPKGKGSVCVAKEKKSNRALRKCAFDPVAKESREKARARARERTRERRSRVKLNELPSASNSEGLNINHELINTSGSWNALENGDELGRQSHYVYPSLDFKEPSSSIDIFSYDPNFNRVSRENHLRDYYQVYGKPWETYSNISPF